MAQEKSIKEKRTEKTAEKIKKETKETEKIISEDKSKEKSTKKTKTKPTEKIKEIKEEKKQEIKPGEKITKVTEEKSTETKEEGAKVEKPEEKKTLGKVYTIPLRDVYNQPWSKRARKATRMMKEFLQKHTKKEVKIAGDVNEAIWSCGMKHPPRKIRVNVEIEDNIATARLLK
ncbi:MAG: 50S ribosomal protein L31e [Candidatus Altarchaeum sp.]|nr:50S ribosomal protein L31e [Candidatus Altarchaeum sp.]